jgi:prepilin-type processing-associated H-X9-DG protein
VLLFIAGLSAAGIAHQVGWLLTSEEPLVESGGGFSRRYQSTHNLKQIGLGLYHYHETHKTFPPAATFDAVGQPLHGWQAMLLPFIEQKDLHDRIDFGVPWDHPRNAPAFQTELHMYLNPSITDRRDGAGYGLSHYAGNADVLGGDVARTSAEVKDGTSNTIMAGEVAGEFKPWGYPANWRDPALGINRSPEGFGSPFPGGASFLFVDGSVRFLKNTIDPQVLKSLGTPAGGERVSTDSY